MILEAEIINDELLEAEIVSQGNSDFSIPDGYIKPDGTKEIVVNGTHNIAEYEFVEVAVPERKEEQEKFIDIVDNGTVEVFPDKEKTLSGVIINVNVDVPEGYIKPEGILAITENGEYDVTEKSGVNVQVETTGGSTPAKPYIDSSKLKYGAFMFSSTHGTDLSLLENLDTSEMVNTSYMFQGRTDITKTEKELIKKLNLANVVSCDYMFANSNIDEAPIIISEKITAMGRIYQGARQLQGAVVINAPNNTLLDGAFGNTTNVQSIELGDTSKVKGWRGTFSGSGAVSISELNMESCTSAFDGIFGNCFNLTNITFCNIPIYNNHFNISFSSKLTVESLLSILNALSDNSELDTTYTVTLGAANLAKLTDEQIAIATSKNINLA